MVIEKDRSGFVIEDNKIITKDDPVIIRKAILAALKKEAESLFPKRINSLKKKTGHLFEIDLKVRPMQTRWGSCQPQKRKIVLNSLLVQLDDSLIDYVIIHELCHLDVANHSARFYKLVESFCPDYRLCQAQLRRTKPVIIKRS